MAPRQATRRLALLAAALAVAGLAVADSQRGVDVAELVKAYRQAQQQAQDSEVQASVLVSFSMPADSLARLAADAGKAHVPLVLRGFAAGSARATWAQVRAIDPDGKAQWLVDPRPFRDLEVQGVPVFVFSDGSATSLVRGDVSLPYALQQIAASKQTHAGQAQTVLERMQENE